MYQMKLKSDMANIFSDVMLKNSFNVKSISFTQVGDEYNVLKHLFNKLGIQHLQMPPYTPEHNAMVERRHRCIIETGKAVLTQANIPFEFWFYAFQTTTYLLNRLLCKPLQNFSPYEALFKRPPNYKKIKIFGCFRFPWLKPYA